MTRFEIVSQIYDNAKAAPYQAGSNDCFFLGLKIVDAIQGTKHVKKFTGSYKTLRGAHIALRKRGHESVVTLLEPMLDPIGWGSASIGDIAVIFDSGAEHVAFHGGQSWHSITAGGPKVWPLSAALQAFKV